MKAKVLVVMPESPYPPRKNGIALRYYPLLLRLCERFDIDLAMTVDDDKAATNVGELEHKLQRVIPLRRINVQPSLSHRIYAQLHRISPVGVPFGHYYYGAQAMAAQFKSVLSEKYHAVVWVTQNHVLHECLPYLSKHRLIVDGIDSSSLHTVRSLPLPDLMARLKIAKAKRWEATIINRAKAAFFISPVDLAEVKSLTKRSDLELSPNGILIDDYTPEKLALKSPSIGFLGNMSYRPNIDAVHRLVAVYRDLKEKIPDLSLYIIGRDPDHSLLDYAKDPDITFTGTIDCIWPYVNAIDVFVMPMAMGAGQQNKLLEVMFAGRPIVASSIANGGVLAVDGESVLIADDHETLKEKTLSLLLDSELRQRLGANGKKFVDEKYNWDRIAEHFAATIDPNYKN